MDADIQNRAKRYSAIKYTLAIIDTVFLLILLIIFQASGLSNLLKLKIEGIFANNFLLIAAYLLVFTLLYYLLNLPLNIFRSFILEHRFNLSEQKFGDWLKDQAKTFIISYIIFLILVEAFYFILSQSPLYWWLIASLFWIFFSVVLARLTPVILIPLFFKYKPLQDANLKERIINLAEKMKVRILDVFEIDFSKKTLKANAAFVGIGKTRRVILADTLKDKYSYDEIEIILAHEFSHYRLRHLWKLIFINSLSIVITFYAIFLTSVWALGLFGLIFINDLAALPILVLYMALIGIITTPILNALSRRFEKNADRLAVEFTGKKEAFISTMEKLADQNLADRRPHPVIKFLFFDHPPIDERIASVGKLEV